ncbi:MAG: S26 family signal peptidase [Rhizomicrobium sp.]
MSARQTVIATLAACALIADGGPKTPRLVWNATASAPIGLYRAARGETLHRGDLVLALPSRSIQQFAASRGYLPFGVPLVKHVAALAHDRICARGDTITINGHVAVIRLTADGNHRPLPAWTGCQTLTQSSVLLLNPDVPQSFDGRYFGPISTTAILGKLVPLWTH